MMNSFILFMDTFIYLIVNALLYGYLTYIWRNSKKTHLLRYYIVMHLLAIIMLFSGYLTRIIPLENIKWLKFFNIFFISCFDISFFCFGYYLFRRKHLTPRLFIIFLFSLQFLFISKFVALPVDTLPLLMGFIFTVLFFGTYKFGLLNTLSLGMIRGFELINEVVLLFDNKGEIIYQNRRCDHYDDGVMHSISTSCQNLIKKDSFLNEEKQLNISGLVLTLSIRPIFSMLGKKIGFVCIVHNDTEITNAIIDLNQKNKELEEINQSIRNLAVDVRRLAVLRERNLLANDIHDVLGHSLNYALQVLESNRIIMGRDPEKAVGRLRQAVKDIDRGLGEIKNNTACVSKSSYPFPLLITRLKKMVKRLAEVGVTVELMTEDELSGYSERIYKTIYRVCQESVTNSLKHGQADKVVISLKKRANRANLFIIDNGKGTTGFKKGSGLTGMEERIKKVNGQVFFSSPSDNQGFIVKASIPLN